jgi:NADPH2:quinone reductase
MGTAAPYVALPSAQAVRLPDRIDFDVGACLGIPALTALRAVLMAGGVQGKTVLVSGGAGAVGNYAVQFARLLGARQVLATASSGEKAGRALRAGADACIQYRHDSVPEAVRELTAGRGVDRVIEVDVAANGAMLPGLLRPGGEAVVYGSGAPTFTLPFGPFIGRHVSLHFFIVYDLEPEDRHQAQALLDGWLQTDSLVHHIDRVLPLTATAEAHELVLSGGATGKVLVTLN